MEYSETKRPDSRKKRSAIGVALVAILLAYAFLSLISIAWLAHQVPLSSKDIANIEMLGGLPSSADVTVLWITGIFFLIGACCFVRRRDLPRRVGAILLGALFLVLPGTEFTRDGLIRLAILEGTARIGCFVKDSRECFDSLGVKEDFPTAPSQFSEESRFAPWAAAKVIGLQGWPVSHAGVGHLLAKAPFYVARGQELREKMAGQRLEVDTYYRELAVRLAARPGYPVELKNDLVVSAQGARKAELVRFRVTPVIATGSDKGINAVARTMLGTLRNCEVFGSPSHFGGWIEVNAHHIECDNPTPGEPREQVAVSGYLRNSAALERGLVGGTMVFSGFPVQQSINLAAGTKATLFLD